jgi:uncharacterized membrane protein
MDETARTRTRSTLLVMSLCLNVGLIALILVGIGRFGRGGPPPPAGLMAPGQIARGLPPKQREEILDIVAAHRPALQTRRRAARRARLEAFRIFASPGYTADEFSRALDQVRDADAALEGEAISVERDVVNVLTPAERTRIAERVRAQRNRPLWRRLMAPPPPPPDTPVR